jgi:hypothetical protein
MEKEHLLRFINEGKKFGIQLSDLVVEKKKRIAAVSF